MGTRLNYAKETRGKYECAKERYREFCLVKNRADESIEAYFESEKKNTLEAIYDAKSSLENALKMLEKDSGMRKEYEEMLEDMEKKNKEMDAIVFGESSL